MKWNFVKVELCEFWPLLKPLKPAPMIHHHWNYVKLVQIWGCELSKICNWWQGERGPKWGVGNGGMGHMSSQLLESSKVVLGYPVANATTMAIVFKSKSKILFARPNFQTIAKVNKIQPLIGTKSYWMASWIIYEKLFSHFQMFEKLLTFDFIVGLYLHCLMSFRSILDH